MRGIVFSLLLIFASFVALPTILSKVYNHIDISFFYNLTEEEERHGSEVYEVIEERLTAYHFWKLNNNSKIISKYTKKYEDVSREVFSPPPEYFLYNLP